MNDDDDYNMDAFEDDDERNEIDTKASNRDASSSLKKRSNKKKLSKKKNRSKSATNLRTKKESYNPVEKTLRNKIKKTQSKNVVMFRRLADAKRAKEAASQGPSKIRTVKCAIKPFRKNDGFTSSRGCRESECPRCC